MTSTKPNQQPPKNEPQPDDQSGLPSGGGGKGRVDVTGIMPDNVRVDPDITEGHPGYEESGDSEIIPDDRFRKEETRKKGE